VEARPGVVPVRSHAPGISQVPPGGRTGAEDTPGVQQVPERAPEQGAARQVSGSWRLWGGQALWQQADTLGAKLELLASWPLRFGSVLTSAFSAGGLRRWSKPGCSVRGGPGPLASLAPGTWPASEGLRCPAVGTPSCACIRLGLDRCGRVGAAGHCKGSRGLELCSRSRVTQGLSCEVKEIWAEVGVFRGQL